MPFGIDDAACVSLPPTMKSVSNISCVVVGGTNLDATIRNKYNSSDVYGLNSSLTSWTHLGKIKKERWGHIVLPLS